MSVRIGIFETDLNSPLSNRGGMSTVYRARIQYDQLHPQRNGKEVALKVAKALGDNADTFETLLKKEIRLLQQLRHNGIVRIIPINILMGQYVGRATELDKKNPPYYFAMELLDGTMLDKLIKQDAFTLEWRVEAFYQIAQAVEYLHLYNHPHRDLKLDNILFRRQPNPTEIPQTVLIDFGLAGKRALKLDAMSVRYAPPERVRSVQARHTEVYDSEAGQAVGAEEKLDRDKASDIWALGVILYEMLNRRHMYPEQNNTAIMNAILTSSPSPMNKDISSRDPKLANFVLDAMLHRDWRSRAKIHEIMEKLAIDITHIAPRI